MRRTRRLPKEAGTQIAELALMTPFLLLLVLGIIEGAAMIRTHQVLNNAAREGARLSSDNACNGSAACVAAIQQAVAQYGADNGISITAAQVQVDQSKIVMQPSGIAIHASQVTVTMAYPLPLLSKLPFGIAATIPIAGTAEFRNFY
jgi:Flp pilus assembly protein TadG